MATLTLSELRELLTDAAGASDAASTAEDYGDQQFLDLGYDSLALMESAAALKRHYGITIPEDVLGDLTTPNEMLAHINNSTRGEG